MIKRLLKSVRAFKKDALLTPFFVVLEVVMEVVIPSVMALLIDRGIDAQNMGEIWKYGAILIGCAALALIFGAAVQFDSGELPYNEHTLQLVHDSIERELSLP